MRDTRTRTHTDNHHNHMDHIHIRTFPTKDDDRKNDAEALKNMCI
jgi:hypothetical protein